MSEDYEVGAETCNVTADSCGVPVPVFGRDEMIGRFFGQNRSRENLPVEWRKH